MIPPKGLSLIGNSNLHDNALNRPHKIADFT